MASSRWPSRTLPPFSLPFAARPSSALRESSASAPPEEDPPRVWESENFAPRSEDGFCCQASDPEIPSSRKPSSSWVSSRGPASGPSVRGAGPVIFYTDPMSRGQIARLAPEEAGAAYETAIVEYGADMKAPAYLAINPMGKVPAIRHEGRMVTETIAICVYLAKACPIAADVRQAR